jgi:glycosyltransferase involved in cell wall biosynthesis
MDLSVVIPIKDERDNLQPLHEQLRRAVDPLYLRYELIFVDDGSTDGSFEVLEQLAARDAKVKVVQLRRNYGQTPALRAGIDCSSGDVIVTMDGDLQNDPADIPVLMDHLRQGYDLVLGWRKDRKDGLWHRKIPSWMANALIRWVTKVTVKDMGCTLRAMRRQAAQELSLYGELHRFIPVLAQNSGHRILQIPVRHHPRRFGKTKYNISRSVRVLLDLVTVKFLHSYLSRPMHVFGAGGLVCIAGGFLSLFVTIAQKFLIDGADGHMNRNPLLLLSVLLTVVGVQFISMGLIGEVLSRTYFESQGKTLYLIRTTLNIDDRDRPAKAA